jgi:hypothetical protein
VKIIALEHERPNVASEQYRPYLKAEAAHLWDLSQSGVLREIYTSARINPWLCWCWSVVMWMKLNTF